MHRGAHVTLAIAPPTAAGSPFACRHQAADHPAGPAARKPDELAARRAITNAERAASDAVRRLRR
jgi:hypothetical protein